MVRKTKGTDNGLTIFRQGDYIGLVDGNGVISVSADLCFSDIKPTKSENTYVAVRDSRYLLIDRSGKQISANDYDTLEPTDEGLFIARRKRRYNLVRSDGTEVLRTWVVKLGDVHNGFFTIGAIENRRQSVPTRHTYGLAHTDGTVVFSPIFEKIVWHEQGFFYAEKDDHPYIIKEDGSIIDLTFEHLPARLEVDQRVFVEKALEWILTGMRIYYRDSEAIINAKNVYQAGKIIRAGFFIDVSSRLIKPLTKLRFLIFSAHVAPWDAINELVSDNPNIGKWGFSTLHCNSYFIVLDVYTKSGVTQVALLHIPPAVAKNIGESAPALIKTISNIKANNGSLVDIARDLLERNLRSRRGGDLNDSYLMQCMHHPIGLNNVFDPVPLEPARLKGDAAALGRLVTRLAKDGDIDDFYTGKIIDNFLWHGLKGSVCEGCIYTKGIAENYRGCGRLTCNSFRRNYMRGVCNYRKPDIATYSQAELDAKHRWSRYQEHHDKKEKNRH